MNGDNNNANKKMWNGNKNVVRLHASIYGKKNAILIGKDVLRVLGGPSHICLKVNQKMDSFLVTPCSERDAMSFRVPENILTTGRPQMDVVSRSFVIGLLAINDLEFDCTYNLSGIYSEKHNAVVFNVADARLYEKK